MNLEGVYLIRYCTIPDLLIVNLEFTDHGIYNFNSLN